MVTEDPFDATRIARRPVAPIDDATQVAAPRVLAAPQPAEVDRSDEPNPELPREHYGIRPAPAEPLSLDEPATPATPIPVLDVEGAAARARRTRLWGAIGLVAAMVAVVVLSGIGLALLL